MKKFAFIYLVGVTLLMSVPVFAENSAMDESANTNNAAVNIDIISSGGGVDTAALRAARKLIGQAIANTTVDTFLVYSPRVGGPIPIEGGISACAEKGFNATPKKFHVFIKQLRSIRPKEGTSINVELVSSCQPIEPILLSCGGITGKQCPSDLICVDDPKDDCDPTRGGADCSGICVAKPK